MNTFELLLSFDIARLIPLVGVFLYAAFQDYHFGEVSDKVWLYGFIGCPLMIAEYVFLAVTILPIAVITSVICVAIAFALSKLNRKSQQTSWGGADSLALVTLAVCYPLAPSYLAWLPLYPIMILSVASVCAVVFMLLRGKQRVRFIPFMLIGLITMVII